MTTTLISSLSSLLTEAAIGVPGKYDGAENFFRLTITTKAAAEKVQEFFQKGDVVS